MTRKQINAQFKQHIALLHKLSHRYANRCGRPEKDLYGQACWLFMKATETYTKDKGEFGTYLFSCVRNGLISWGKKNDLPPTIAKMDKLFDQHYGEVGEPYNPTQPDDICLRDESYNHTPVETLMFKEWLAGLNEEVRDVMMIVLNGPAEVLDIPLTAGKKIVMGALRRHLRETKDWSWPHIWNVLRETKRSVAAFSLK